MSDGAEKNDEKGSNKNFKSESQSDKKSKPTGIDTKTSSSDSSGNSKADTTTTPRGTVLTREVAENIPYSQYIELLQAEQFFTDNVKLLTTHRFVTEAKAGKLSTNRAKRFVAENYYVLKSDMRSFEVASEMYGHINDTYGKFFEFLRIGTSYAHLHLQNLRQALKVTEAELAKYEPSPKTHCYPAYFSWLITHTNPTVIALCYAVHYPTWGQMCKSLYEAIQGNPKYRLSENDCMYFKFLSEPLADMDLLVKDICKLGEKEDRNKKYSYKQVKDCVRLLQGYLINFWDGICEGAYCA